MRTIPLNKGCVTVVDDDVYDEISRHRWFVQANPRNRYAQRKVRNADGSRRTVYLHRAILEVTDPKTHVDHINHDGLDNRRANLRVATNNQNAQNQRKSQRLKSSVYKGVFWHVRKGKWQASIGIPGRLVHLGYFTSELEAAIAYNQAALELFGEFAYINDFNRMIPDLSWLLQEVA